MSAHTYPSCPVADDAHAQLAAIITARVEKSKALFDELGASPEDRRNAAWRAWAKELEPDQLDEILKKLQWGLGSDNVWRAAVIEARRRLCP